MKNFPSLRFNKSFLKNFKPEIELFLKKKLDINGLSCTDFSGNVKIEFLFGDKMFFKNAFYVIKEDMYAIFTEHCGYYYFEKDEIEKIIYKQNFPSIIFNKNFSLRTEKEYEITEKKYEKILKKSEKLKKKFKPIIIKNGILQ